GGRCRGARIGHYGPALAGCLEKPRVGRGTFRQTQDHLPNRGHHLGAGALQLSTVGRFRQNLQPQNPPGAVGGLVRKPFALGGGDPDLFLRPDLPLAQSPSLPGGYMNLWIAQGFGVGRIPIAPGTFGSLVGLGWLALLLCAPSWPVFILGNMAALALSVWLC